MIQFTRDTVDSLNPGNTVQAQAGIRGPITIYSVLTPSKFRRGLAHYANSAGKPTARVGAVPTPGTESKVRLLQSAGEDGLWIQPASRGHGRRILQADASYLISEEEFTGFIQEVHTNIGVRNIGAPAMRIVFAGDNLLRAHFLGLRKERLTPTHSSVRFTNEIVSSEDLRRLGISPKILARLIANEILSETH